MIKTIKIIINNILDEYQLKMDIEKLDLVLETFYFNDSELDKEHVYHKINGFESHEYDVLNDKIQKLKM